MSQIELLALVVAVFSKLEIPYMVVGSYASTLYGEPRSTHDVDLVIELNPARISDLCNSFDSSRYYLSEVAFLEGRMANIIDLQSGDKIDCFILDDSDLRRTAFERRHLKYLMGIEVFVESAEDTIVSKLMWNRKCGGSQRQISDVRSILVAQLKRLDMSYLRDAAGKASVQTDLESLLKETQMETQTDE